MSDTGWHPPEIDGDLKVALGGSFVDEFVLGHRPIDVLRELVQNEFDAGGKTLKVYFGSEMLSVTGSGKPISKDGWKRLSVIVGTGRTIGDEAGDTIQPKSNGIGSKNFGLRSLFLFGDRIFVRSSGQIAVLDLPTLGTTRQPEKVAKPAKGVSVHVGYRSDQYGKLEAFTEVAEGRAFNSMAGGVLSTLNKLSLAGEKGGLGEVVLESERLGRKVHWRQKAERTTSKAPGVEVIRRKGRLVESLSEGSSSSTTFEELEFARTISLKPEYAAKEMPGYYGRSAGKLRLAVSVSLERGRPKVDGVGHFYYPLKAPMGGTGTAIDVNAPFELNGDRSAILDNDWNQWLCDEAAKLVVDLLSADWFDRFGAAAFLALLKREPAEPRAFQEALHLHLSSAKCWPTMSTGRKESYGVAKDLVVAAHPAFLGHIDASSYIDESLVDEERIQSLATASGAKTFTANSLIRLRCAPKDNSKLQTKLSETEANYHFPNYEIALRDERRQVAFATALGQIPRLSNENYRDLKTSISTLTKDMQLAPASKLVRVDPSVENCPRPPSEQLHPSLYALKAISSHCMAFDEEKWIREVCDRALLGLASEAELESVERRIIEVGANYGRLAIAAIRRSPVVRDSSGNRSSPDDMVNLGSRKEPFLRRVLSTPTRAMAKNSGLMAKLNIRSSIEPSDLVKAAEWVSANEGFAVELEDEIARRQGLLTRPVVKRLSSVPFLRTMAQTLDCPENLHIDNALNRLCISADRIVLGNRIELYRKLRIRETPDHDAILESLDGLVERGEAPERPEAFYEVLAIAAERDDDFHSELQVRPILWVGGEYHFASEVLAGHLHPRFFDDAVPVVRRSEGFIRNCIAIGASALPHDEHWTKYFEAVEDNIDAGEAVSSASRRALLEAYALRSSAGLPADISSSARCLLDRTGRIFSLNDVESGSLVENDFAALADAIDVEQLPIGVVDPIDRTRAFYRGVNISRLTSICGAGQVEFGQPATSQRWFDPQHRGELLSRVRAPHFLSAVHMLANSFQQGQILMPSEDEFKAALLNLEGIEVFETIERQFDLHGYSVSVAAEVGLVSSTLGIVRPKSKLDVHQLVAQALAELVGFKQIADARLFAASIMPLFQCNTRRDVGIFLERQGIVTPDADLLDEDVAISDLHEREELVEDVFEDIRNSMLGGSFSGSPASGSPLPPPPPPPPAAPPPPPPPPFELPPLGSVTPNVEQLSGTTIEVRSSSDGDWRNGWSSSGWRAPTPADTARDSMVGSRGEELVYKLELERVRGYGHENPEELVFWISQGEPGADHDIRSIDQNGRPLLIEVKSTTGLDGRFMWPRREFELAVSFGDQYELVRVYDAASLSPTVKRFPNPVRLLGSRQLTLDLADLRANIEGCA